MWLYRKWTRISRHNKGKRQQKYYLEGMGFRKINVKIDVLDLDEMCIN